MVSSRSLQRFVFVAVCCGLLGLLPVFATHAGADERLRDRIDRAIDAQAGGPAAAPASDAEFLRRATLDLTGVIPTPDDVTRFLADPDPQKREKTIDRLLDSPDYGRRMQEAFTAMLLERRGGSPAALADWNRYLRESFQADKPWDQLVRELLFADDDERLAPARKFLTVAGRDKNPHQLTQDVARLFLGRNILCAQCHDHPNVEDYKQSDYFGLFSYLQEKPEQARSEFESVFSPGKRETFPRLPERAAVEVPTFTKEQAQEARQFRPRLLLARDLPAPDNRLFARNSVNRFWFLMTGRGLVHPLDLLHAGNPPSHPELLDLLADDFVEQRFGVKRLLREIANSRMYQRSSEPPEGVRAEDVPAASYRMANPKPLSPEQLAWSLMRATGRQAAIEQAAPGATKFGWYDYINGRIAAPPATLPDVLDLFVGVFGNPPGEAEVEFTPSMGQALFLLNERLVLDWLKPQSGSLVERLSKLEGADTIAEQMTLAIYGRPAGELERQLVRETLERAGERKAEALGDLAWALLASDEFRMNR